MSRLKNNLKNKTRRRMIFFSLLSTAILFVSALVVTNNTMVRMTDLTREKSPVLAQDMGTYITKKVNSLANNLREISVHEFGQNIGDMVEKVIDIMKSLKFRWQGL